MSRAVSTTEDPQLGPPVSKYPPTSGYGQSNGNSRRNLTFGHMHRDSLYQNAGPEQIDSLYPSGFPRHGVASRKTSRTADRMLIHFKQDPDIEVRPVVSGTLVSKCILQLRPVLLSVTVESALHGVCQYITVTLVEKNTVQPSTPCC